MAEDTGSYYSSSLQMEQFQQQRPFIGRDNTLNVSCVLVGEKDIFCHFRAVIESSLKCVKFEDKLETVLAKDPSFSVIGKRKWKLDCGKKRFPLAYFAIINNRAASLETIKPYKGVIIERMKFLIMLAQQSSKKLEGLSSPQLESLDRQFFCDVSGVLQSDFVVLTERKISVKTGKLPTGKFDFVMGKQANEPKSICFIVGNDTDIKSDGSLRQILIETLAISAICKDNFVLGILFCRTSFKYVIYVKSIDVVFCSDEIIWWNMETRKIVVKGALHLIYLCMIGNYDKINWLENKRVIDKLLLPEAKECGWSDYLTKGMKEYHPHLSIYPVRSRSTSLSSVKGDDVPSDVLENREPPDVEDVVNSCLDSELIDEGESRSKKRKINEY